MEAKKYKRLSYKERVIIETLLGENKSKSFIANELKRSRSCITRELKKWIVKPTDRYKADLAHWAAEDDYLNKRNLDKISTHKSLRWYVYRGLLEGWSPEQISGKIKKDYPGNCIMSISYEAIYAHIYKPPKRNLNKKLIALLPYSKTKRYKIKGSKGNKISIKDRVMIDNRPVHIEDRIEVGHWEGDLMIGPKQASAIGTLVERKTRFVYIVKLENKKSETVTKGFKQKLNNMSSTFKKTMTYDNGTEMANHKWFTKNTRMKVYFAHPYSSWERGTNENTNGLIRRFLPKQTDFHTITEAQLQMIQDKLNNRPRKILGFNTPNQMIEKEKICCC